MADAALSRPDDKLARGIVRQEARLCGQAAFEAAWQAMHGLDERLMRALVSRRKLSDADIAKFGREIVAVAGTQGSVIFAEHADFSASKLSKKGAGETFVGFVLPETDLGTQGLRTHHRRLDRKSLTIVQHRPVLEVTPHAAERLVQRGCAPRDGIRRLARGLVARAGMFAAAMRLWHYFPQDEAGYVAVSVPLEDGLAVGRLVFCEEDDVRPVRHRFQDDIVSDRPGLSPFAVAPGHIHAENRTGIGFLAMTFVGPGEMTGAQADAKQAMEDWEARHPVLRLMGTHLLWPTSVSAERAVANSREQVAEAMADFVRLYEDRAVRRLFRLSAPPSTVPLAPWAETPADRVTHLTAKGPAWRTAETMRDIRRGMAEERLRELTGGESLLPELSVARR